MNPSPPRHTLTTALWLGYLTFVVYGSLVPLDFRSVPLAQAWLIFQHTPMFRLGIESRADWIANGVLYVPVGFLTAHLLIHGLGNKAMGAVLPRLFLAGVFSVTLALGVEFTQIFFPPRTVSLNDLLAECIGSLLGLLLAAKYSDWFKSLLHAIFDAPGRLVLHAVEAYLAGYIAFSLFPYDVLLNSAEIGQKIQGNDWGWLLANDTHGKLQSLLKLLPEAFLTLPFGLYLGFLGDRAHRRPVPMTLAALLGALLGGVVEIAQFFTASGISQGLSIASRALGICGGVALWRRRDDWSPEKASAFVRRHTVPLGAGYLLLLWLVNGGFSARPQGVDEALARLTSLHFLPFYYHYYTTEARALLRLVSVCFMYLPIGLLVWARRGTPTGAFWLALATAFAVETGKLFLPDGHPDPTNIFLGALAGWGALHMAGLIEAAMLTAISATTSHARHRSHTTAVAEAPPPPMSAALGKTEKIHNDLKLNNIGAAVAIALLAGVFWHAATFPVLAVPLCLLLAAIAIIVWRRPELSLLIVPLALPVLDLAPWSGRFYLDEFDLLVAVCLIVGYLRLTPCARRTAPTRTDPVFKLALVLLAASFAISALRGLLPWQMPDANAFTNYFSAFNALRIGKGALWALLFYALLQRLATSHSETGRLLATGMIGGLALTVAFVAWERMAFASLFDFSNAYRITGPFSAMHVGGAYIECFLVVAAPFLLIRILQTKSLLNKALGTLLLVGTTYALMVTYSRNGYAAYALGLMTCLALTLCHVGQRHRTQHALFVAVLSGIMLAVAIPVFSGKFAQQRIATVGKDFVVRQSHWEDAYDIRQKSWGALLFGTGLGRYPAEHYLFSGEKGRAGTYQLRTENGNTFLTLTAGAPLYVEQMVDIEPRGTYVLKLDIRSATAKGRVDLSLCEKWMLASANCDWKTLTLGAADTWTPIQLQLSSTPFSDKPWYAERPIRFTVHSPTLQTRRIDVDNIRLETLHGKNLLANGDFSQEFDHWFFTVDNHLQWHAKSLPVSVWFDQGMLGVLAFGLFALIACQRATRLAWQGNPHATAGLAAFVAFLTVGLFDTLIDTPRFLFLLLLLGLFCASLPQDAVNAKNEEPSP